jgi:hypothetical protein
VAHSRVGFGLEWGSSLTIESLICYAQVLDELQSGSVTRSYACGTQLVSESQALQSTWTTSWHGYGRVRYLTKSVEMFLGMPLITQSAENEGARRNIETARQTRNTLECNEMMST